MYLNTIKPAKGSVKTAKRVGRGIGSGLGKTCGRGHKGQKSRSGGYHKINFEGGQMPIQRRLPKFGFKSRVSRYHDELTLTELNKLEIEIVDLDVLKAASLVKKHTKHVKVIKSGELNKAFTLQGIKVTKGAREIIESAGGKVEE
jgi:large subunit ribosomal protein L15